tara:strand:- start:1071 stop:1301 length:231 start_codon:yes stop_codon:yes gene_type:complete
MEYVLTLILCSAVANSCLPPHVYPNTFPDAYSCMVQGYQSSLEKTIDIGPEDINSAKMYIKFGCIPQPIEKKGVST